MAKKENTIARSHPEAKGILLLVWCFISLLAFCSYDASDPTANWFGIVGHGYAWFFLYLFGLTVYPLIGFLGWVGWSHLLKGEFSQLRIKSLYLTLLTISLGILFSLSADKEMPIPGALKHKVVSETAKFSFPYPHRSLRYYLGGVPLYYLYHDLPRYNMHRLLGDLGTGITFALMGIISSLFLTDTKIIDLVQAAFLPSRKKSPPIDTRELEKKLSRVPLKPIQPQEEKRAPSPSLVPEITIRTLDEKEEKKPTPKPRLPSKHKGYELPPPSLLTSSKKVDQPLLKKELQRQATILEETLFSFGIEAKVGDINCGPTITSFEIHPAIGVKVQKITALENDIALKLQAKSIRMIAPIPGKGAIGVEIPSPYPQEVSFKEMLLAYQEGARQLHLPIILGKTVSGENVFSDLSRMPHCLISGTTGSGKSVCISCFILSLLMNKTPDELKLIMIDPKKVELTPYAELPHLIAPVITEPHEAYAALNWMVKEMLSRYEILKQMGFRNITSFNSRKIDPEQEASFPFAVPEKMAAIVCIIDEFADLMMASSSDFETPIARLAQMARAVNLHLVLATQRPSRDIVTGLIKANMPTRIAFKVASGVNSRIILDEDGAQRLLGNGDFLFLPPSSSHLIRAQGAYISDADIHRVVQFIRDQAPPNYLITSFDHANKGASGEEGGSDMRDPLYAEAKAVVTQTQTASTTYLQRKFKIGYARAASLMDELEMHGVISPQEGSKPRRVLIENTNKPS